ncbi:hypothetical protein PENTCL1PPCAC_6663, partial [Pristionchus entomophagus]
CLSSECCHLLLSSISLNHHEATGKSKSGGGPRDPAGAVIYTICIITLFSSLIILLMVRAIKPREDEQVTSVLCNMRVRVDREELRRRQNQMREAKKSAQKWLGQLKSRRLSFRRANSENGMNPPSTPLLNPSPRPPSRANSYQGYLPEIVVTGEPIHGRKPVNRTVSRSII